MSIIVMKFGGTSVGDIERIKNIAQISGLVNQKNPTKAKSSSQLQISSNLFYDVFIKFTSFVNFKISISNLK